MNMKLGLILALAVVAISAVVAKPSYNEVLDELRELAREDASRGKGEKGDGGKGGKGGKKSSDEEKSGSHEGDDETEKAFHHEQMEAFAGLMKFGDELRKGKFHQMVVEYCKTQNFDVDKPLTGDETRPDKVTADHFKGALEMLKAAIHKISTDTSSAGADSENLNKQFDEMVKDPANADWEKFGKDNENLGTKMYTAMASMEAEAGCAYYVLRPLLFKLAIFGVRDSKRCSDVFHFLVYHAHINQMDIDKEACSLLDTSIQVHLMKAFHNDTQCVAKDVEATKQRLEKMPEHGLEAAGEALQLMTLYDDMRMFKGSLHVIHQLYTKQKELTDAGKCTQAPAAQGGKRMLDETVMRKIKALYIDLKKLQ